MSLFHTVYLPDVSLGEAEIEVNGLVVDLVGSDRLADWVRDQARDVLDQEVPDASDLWHDGIESRVQQEIHETLNDRGLDPFDGDTIWEMVGPIVQRHIADAQWATDPEGRIAQELKAIGQAHQQAVEAFGRLVALLG